MAFSLNSQQISEHAFRLIGALGHGEALQGEDYNIALTSLNMVLEYVQRLGHIPINLATETIDMVASTGTYTLANTDVIDIVYAYARKDGLDYKVDVIPSRLYDEIADKDDEGDIPQVLLFDRIASPQVTLWPVPNDATVDLILREVRNTAESTAASGTLDIPAALYRPVSYLLAAELAPQYGLSVQKAEYFRRVGSGMLTDMFSELTDDWDTDWIPGAF
jgi:hypothetical protein